MSDTTISNEFPDSIAEHLRSIIADGTTQCPLCGCTSVHEHTPAEIVIYRNGVKYGRSLTDSGQQLATTERLLAESQAREMERTEGLTDVIACVDAAMAEGLAERLAELPVSVGTIRDLVERRLLWASFYAREALSKTPGDSTALDAAIAKAKLEATMIAVGWTHALCCAALDDGTDPREIEGGEIVAKAEQQLLADELKGGEQ